MMLRLWQKKLKLKYSKDVFDVVQFGSSVLEGVEPNDLDIAVVFDGKLIKDQVGEAHEIKRQIEKFVDIKVQVESFSLRSFFDKGNFAREGIFFGGRSLLTGKYFSENFGLVPKLRISYVLRGLEKKDKVRFNYLLSGKGGNYGLLKKYGGELVSPGAVEVSPEHERVFLEKMKRVIDKVEVERAFVLR